MDPKVSALERAFQLARSGQVASIDDIKKRLKREGYEEKAVDGGPSLAGQLRKLISEARERKGGPIAAPSRSARRSTRPPAAASAAAAAGPSSSRFRRSSRGGIEKGSHAGACRGGSRLVTGQKLSGIKSCARGLMRPLLSCLRHETVQRRNGTQARACAFGSRNLCFRFPS